MKRATPEEMRSAYARARFGWNARAIPALAFPELAGAWERLQADARKLRDDAMIHETLASQDLARKIEERVALLLGSLDLPAL